MLESALTSKSEEKKNKIDLSSHEKIDCSLLNIDGVLMAAFLTRDVRIEIEKKMF